MFANGSGNLSAPSVEQSRAAYCFHVQRPVLGQASWVDETGLFFVIWSMTPKYLGVIDHARRPTEE